MLLCRLFRIIIWARLNLSREAGRVLYYVQYKKDVFVFCELYVTHNSQIIYYKYQQVPTTQLAKMSIDPKFVELTADVVKKKSTRVFFALFFFKLYRAVALSRTTTTINTCAMIRTAVWLRCVLYATIRQYDTMSCAIITRNVCLKHLFN